MYWPYLVNIIIKAIFNGATVVVALFVLLMPFRIKIRFIDKEILVRAINCTLLLGAAIYLLAFVADVLIAYYSQIEYEQYAIINRVFGPYWFSWVILLLSTFILPQLVWIKRFRKSIITAVVILLFYKLSTVFEFISLYFFNNSNWVIRIQWSFSELLVQLVIYILILAGIYFAISKINRNKKFKEQGL